LLQFAGVANSLFLLLCHSGTTSLRRPEALKVTYDQHRHSLPLSVTVPHYSATEFLSAMCYLTFQDRMTNKLELRDLLSKFQHFHCSYSVFNNGSSVLAIMLLCQQWSIF
jgi:hypothetical protein